MSSLSQRLDQARLSRGLGKKELADRAGLSPSAISNLLSGRRTSASMPTLRSLAEALDVSLDWLTRGVGQLARRARTVVPLMGYVPAGKPLPPVEDVVDLVEVPDHLERSRPDYALVVRGDSMIDDGVSPGDIIYVRQQPVADDGDIVVAMVEDPDVVVTLKRWHLRRGYAVLEPGNVRYQPLVTRNVRILGKVVGARPV